jgi:hypothetical protein
MLNANCKGNSTMNFGRKFATLTAAAAFLALSVGSAFAVSAQATGAVNVRTGPGTSYQRVDTLRAGETVDVQRCQSGWCYIEHNGPDGWVSANYLSRTSGPSGGGSSSGNRNPDFGFSFEFGPDGGGFSFGNRPAPWPRPQPLPLARACFYTGTNYTGQSFCVNAGQSIDFLGRWNDRISSVRTYGSASVTMCQHASFDGYCRSTRRDEPFLGRWLNDQVSSVRVN